MSVNRQNRSSIDASAIGARLRQAREGLGLTRRALEARTGIPAATIKAYESGKSIPGGEAIIRLSDAGIRPEWLLLGTDSERSDDEFVSIPVINVEASAGHGTIVDSEEVAEAVGLPRRLLREQHINPANTHILYVRGDSMEPTLREGDIVLVDRGHEGEIPRREGIYVISVDGELMVKRMVFAGQRGEGHDMQVIWRLVSDNPAYPPIEVDLFGGRERLSILGRVRMVMRWM